MNMTIMQNGAYQPLWPPGNYEPLYKTIKEGVPEVIQQNVDKFLNDYFTGTMQLPLIGQ